jgi:hypothetical protein
MLRGFLIVGGMMVVFAGYSQVLKKLSYSACMMECKDDSTSVKEINEVKGTTFIKLLTHANCAGNFDGEVKRRGGKVDLIFWIKPTIIKKKNGEIVEILETADCDCPFEVSFEISDLKNIGIDSILVNGRSIRDMNKYPERFKTFR